MNFGLSDEQVLLREAAASALDRVDTVAAARAALDGAPLPDLWPAACAAGWPDLLVPEEDGGAGLGFFDAMLVLEECGRRLASPGLIGHLGATLLAGSFGEERAVFAYGEPAELREGRVTGSFRFVIDLPGAEHVVVPAREDGEPCAALLGRCEVEPLVRGDASRPLGHLALERAPAERIEADLDRVHHLGQALLAADALGVAGAALDLAVAYAKERQAFGRPIGSYGAIKQQIVEILRHAETARNLCFYVGYAAEHAPEELALAAAAARFAGERAADYATRTCIAVHGGIGATWEHDAPLYWRRAQLSRLLLGGEARAADTVAEQIIERARGVPA